MKTYEERMAAVQQKLQRKQTQRRALLATAGALCLCLVALFLWPRLGADKLGGQYDDSNIRKYKDSPYYNVIAAIDKYYAIQDEIREPVTNGGYYGEIDDAMPPAENLGNTTNSSVEITDNQVAGVLEADIIKRSQTHVFYLIGDTLEVYAIGNNDIRHADRFELSINPEVYYHSDEMYLSEDASRLTVLGRISVPVTGTDRYISFVQVISLDVSDPTDVKQVSEVYLGGGYASSRMVGDQLLVTANYYVEEEDVDFDNEWTYLPQYGSADDLQSIPSENIIISELTKRPIYTTVFLVDAQTLDVIDSSALLNYSARMYVTQENIYITRYYAEKQKVTEDISESKGMTEIACLAYNADGLEYKGSFCVEGEVKNQYSMDEHEGIFRVVTTTSKSVTYATQMTTTGSRLINANLYCFQLDSMEQLALVERFAPDGESVQSVRFDGNYAYVCTAVVATMNDPVFFFDLTDLENITYKDTGTITGFSSSLIQLQDGYLMGIGYNEYWYLKVEIYKETDTGVVSVCTYNRETYFETNYKAYYIDRENNLFGIPTGDGYLLLHFDAEELTEATISRKLGSASLLRGFVEDNCLYVFGQKGCDLKEINLPM